MKRSHRPSACYSPWRSRGPGGRHRFTFQACTTHCSFCLTRERNDFQLFPIRFWCYVKQSLFQTDTFFKICKQTPPPPHTHTTTETKSLSLFPFIVEPAFPPATFLTFLNPDDTALLHLSYAVHRHSPWEIIFNNIVESNFPASDFG